VLQKNNDDLNHTTLLQRAKTNNSMAQVYITPNHHRELMQPMMMKRLLQSSNRK